MHPVVFGAFGEVSAEMEVLIGRLAGAWAPEIAEQHQYLLDNVLAAEGIAKSILRERCQFLGQCGAPAAAPPFPLLWLHWGLRKASYSYPRKGKKDKDNSDGGGRQAKKNKDKPDFAKIKSRKRKDIKTRQKAGKGGRTQRRRVGAL
jgi:hypothetical protein